MLNAAENHRLYLRVSPDLIYRLAQKGRILAPNVGNQWHFKKEKVDRWM